MHFETFEPLRALPVIHAFTGRAPGIDVSTDRETALARLEEAHIDLLSRLGRGALESQRLLVPLVLERPAREVEILAEIEPLLERLGIAARPFGPRSVAVDAVPTLLQSRNADAGAFVGDLLAKAVEHGSLLSLEAALHEIVDMMSCKAAVKAGDALGDAEIRDLLRMRETVERATACPHGRPTSIRIPRGELERRFGRS